MMFRRAGSRIVHETFDDEVVVINLENGCYYSLTGSAPIIWEILDEATSGDEIAAELARRCGCRAAEVGRDVAGFLKELEAEGLVVGAPAADRPHETTPRQEAAAAAGFARPEMKKYTDQRELLLLDPIHEVDDLGWPEKK